MMNRVSKKAVFLVFLKLVLLPIYSHAGVYGDTDDRHEVFEMPSQIQEFAKAVPARILKSYLNFGGDINSSYSVNGPLLGREHCSTIRFADQILAGPHVCTGFLVKDDMVMTAGHCFRDPESDCRDYAWVFDYALKGAGDRTYVNVLGRNIYSCKKVISRRLEGFGAVDYTLIQLDRKVTDRQPLSLELVREPQKGQSVFVIGYPSGLPQKIADNSTILAPPEPQQFVTDTDAFQGNSGSPVFDFTTGKVIGIVSGGQNDYTRVGSCKDLKICRAEDNCIPSKMSRISNILLDPVLKDLFK
jgi:hypothetical protein